MLRLPALATALLLTACGTAPASDQDKIAVVRGGILSNTPPLVRQSTPKPATTPVPAAAPRQLSVEETAQIRTDQMWSEPIPADEL